MVRRVERDIIRIFPIFKKQCDIFKKSGLVVFNGKVVMSIAFADNIGSDFTLGQQGIAGNLFALDID